MCLLVIDLRRNLEVVLQDRSQFHYLIGWNNTQLLIRIIMIYILVEVRFWGVVASWFLRYYKPHYERVNVGHQYPHFPPKTRGFSFRAWLKPMHCQHISTRLSLDDFLGAHSGNGEMPPKNAWKQRSYASCFSALSQVTRANSQLCPSCKSGFTLNPGCYTNIKHTSNVYPN